MIFLGVTCPEGKPRALGLVFFVMILRKCGVNYQFFAQDFVGGESTSPLISSGSSTLVDEFHIPNP